MTASFFRVCWDNYRDPRAANQACDFLDNVHPVDGPRPTDGTMDG
jgi:hypothetical protein